MIRTSNRRPGRRLLLDSADCADPCARASRVDSLEDRPRQALDLRSFHRAFVVFSIVGLSWACSDPRSASTPTEDPGNPSVPVESGAHPRHDEISSTGHEGHSDHGDEPGVVELSPEAESLAQIRTQPVERRLLAPRRSTTGRVDFDQERLAHVSPRISGRVHRVHATLGQEVRAGQVLAEIDSIDLGQARSALLQARAKEDLARSSFERVRALREEDIVSEQQLFEAEAVLREARATLQTAEETLRLYGLEVGQVEEVDGGRRTSIYPLRAPFDGTVTERHVTLGELVIPERNLFTLADLDRMWIWIDVYQRDLGSVHLGDQALARVDAYPGEVFAGTVSYLSPEVDTDTRTVRARIDVANRDRKLRPGMFVEVELIDPHAEVDDPSRRPGWVVPEDAVVRDGGTSVVFVALGEHRFERRQVRTGSRVAGQVEIADGLVDGEEVVVEGAFLLKSVAAKESLAGGHSH